MPATNEQLIICYDTDEGTHKYDSAYTKDQAKRALVNCVTRYGSKCNARVVVAKMLTEI